MGYNGTENGEHVDGGVLRLAAARCISVIFVHWLFLNQLFVCYIFHVTDLC